MVGATAPYPTAAREPRWSQHCVLSVPDQVPVNICGRNSTTRTPTDLPDSKRPMYRLGELSDSRRKTIGAGLLILGLLGLALGVIWIHYSKMPVDAPHSGIWGWIPRGVMWKGLGYLIVLGATTLALTGGAFLWVLNQKMTWTRAMVAAILAWIAMVFYMGMVPSEWLSFAQTDLDWSGQRVAFAIPSFLMLGNQVEISYKVLKDVINVGYYHVVLIGAAVLALQVQKIKLGRPAAAARSETQISPYGRPLVRGDR